MHQCSLVESEWRYATMSNRPSYEMHTRKECISATYLPQELNDSTVADLDTQHWYNATEGITWHAALNTHAAPFIH